MYIATTLLLASVATGQLHGVGMPPTTDPPAHVTFSVNVSNTSELADAMALTRYYVSEIVMAAGVYLLADEPRLNCSPDPLNYFLCIGRSLTIRAAAGAKVVLDGGGKKGVVYIRHGDGVWPAGRITGTLQGLEIINGNTSDGGGFVTGGIGVGGSLVLTGCSVHDNVVRPPTARPNIIRLRPYSIYSYPH